MKVYIGLGGIGCRTLRKYADSFLQSDNDRICFYINHEYTELDEKYSYVIPDMTDGTGTYRCIGKNSIQYELYTGTMRSLFQEIENVDHLQIIFVLSSFGGFGSAALLPVLEYVEAINWGRVDSCHVLAFNENTWKQWGFPRLMIQKYEINTISFVNELAEKEQDSNLIISRNQKNIFNPSCTSYLIDTTEIDIDDYWRYIDLSENEWAKLDCKKKYLLNYESNSKEEGNHECDVFISYSFADQKIADQIADKLIEEGIDPWIATRRIKGGFYAKQIMQGIRNANVFLVLIGKNSIHSEQVKNEIDRAFYRLREGIKIIVWQLDDTEWDDGLTYYLCRQEKIGREGMSFEDYIRTIIDHIKLYC